MIRSSLLSVAAGSLAIWLSTPSAAHAEDRGEDSDSSDDSDEEIVVTGTRTETTRKESVVATQVIDRTDIETSGASTVADLLESQPGVSLQRTFAGTSIQLQGMNPEHTLILVDGQRIAGRKNGAIDMSRYPVDWIERIEIVKGPSSALYGSEAMGGVINIITRKADKPFSVDAWGSYGTPADIDGSASLAVVKDGTSARLHGGHRQSCNKVRRRAGVQDAVRDGIKNRGRQKNVCAARSEEDGGHLQLCRLFRALITAVTARRSRLRSP
jgi:outer membrane receptor for ferrienterochelin and colicins